MFGELPTSRKLGSKNYEITWNLLKQNSSKSHSTNNLVSNIQFLLVWLSYFKCLPNVLFWWQFFERLSFFYKKFCNMYLKIGAEVRIGNCLAIITFLYSTHNILWLVLSWINQVISHTKPFMAIYFLQLLHFVCDNQIKKSGNRLKLTQPHPFAFRAHNETKKRISWKEVQHFDMSSWN